MRTGLVSISFRKLAPAEILRLCERCGLREIEWGGDIHVPLGDIDAARRVRRETEGAGCIANCYGSYVRMREADRVHFPALVETARALGAPMIRVWAGTSEADDFSEIAQSAQMLCDMAKDIKIAFEFHGNTLTHDAASAYKLLTMIGRANCRSQWQPPVGLSEEGCLSSIETMLPFLENAHVFSWEGTTRLPLTAHEGRWRKYLRALPKGCAAMLEFVENDDPEALLRDANTLNRWIEEEKL